MTAHCFRLARWTLAEFIILCLDFLREQYKTDYYLFLAEKATDLIGLRGGGRRRAYLETHPIRALVIFLALYDLMNSGSPKSCVFGPHPQDRNVFGYWALSEVQAWGNNGENKEAAPRAITVSV